MIQKPFLDLRNRDMTNKNMIKINIFSYEQVCSSLKIFFNHQYVIKFISTNGQNDVFNSHITKDFLASINDKINQNALDNNNNNPIDKINTIRYYIIRLSCSGLIIAIIYLLSKNSDTIHKFFLKKPVVETENASFQKTKFFITNNDLLISLIAYNFFYITMIISN